MPRPSRNWGQIPNQTVLANRQGDGVEVHQAGGRLALLAPLDEHLAEGAVLAAVGGQVEPFSADGPGGGTARAPPGHVPLDRRLGHGRLQACCWEWAGSGASRVPTLPAGGD